MKVLHDWDNPHRSGKRAIYRGIKLILYGICKKLKIRLRFLDDIYYENRRYLETMIKIDKLVGVTSIIGIRNKIYNHYPNINTELEEYGLDIRKHIHVGNNKNPDRKRIWIPELTQSENTWHYDKRWISKNEPELKDNELPIWHVDYPEFIFYYIEFLYEKLIGGSVV